MEELLKRVSENHDVIDEFTADEVTAASDALREFVAAVKAGEQEADNTVLDELAEIKGRLTARAEALAAERAEFEAKLAELDDTPEEPEAVEPEGEVVEDEPVEEPELVTAAAKVEMGAVAKRVPAERQPKPQAPALIASGTTERIETPLDLAARSITAMKNLGARFDQPKDVARFSYRSEFVIDDAGSEEKGAEVLAEVRRWATSQPKEPESLTAALAFCAPAQPIYEQFGNVSTDGLLTLPTVTATRGRITYPTSLSFQSLTGQSGIGNEWTGTGNKNVYTFACPETVSCEVVANVTIIQVNNATGRFYPEAVADLNAKAIATARQDVNSRHLLDIVGDTKVNTLEGEDTGAGAIVNIANNIAYHAAEYREKYRLSKGAVLDAVFPHWVFDALWVDAFARDSTNEYAGVRARLSGMLSDLNIRPQFVYGWQDISPDLFGTFPASVDVMLWEPGTVVRLDSGTLDLGVVRDSTLNATNDYQTFVETFEGICVPGHEILLINDIPICPTGGTGNRVTINCSATPS